MSDQPIICDGCRVRNPWEHRCYGHLARVNDERANGPCACEDCRAAEHRERESRRGAFFQLRLRDVQRRIRARTTVTKQRRPWRDAHPSIRCQATVRLRDESWAQCGRAQDSIRRCGSRASLFRSSTW